MNTNESAIRLKALREQAGLTQIKLAELSGVHKVNICKMEKGRLPIGGYSLLRLARALSAAIQKPIDPYYLAGESSDIIFQKN